VILCAFCDGEGYGRFSRIHHGRRQVPCPVCTGAGHIDYRTAVARAIELSDLRKTAGNLRKRIGRLLAKLAVSNAPQVPRKPARVVCITRGRKTPQAA
jgi:hypothetical protein